ncbi:D-alanine--D-alanine ligase [Lacticigenium naphthae]|uniref:D-alanine--D-alanine ligase n=1 Tax=Lacticigenium naphthae TaxID=515351 RepID=UPI0004875ED3|nr:D-alanine--D-alanine ligase [Lacticigenium naphthae]
MNIFLIYGGKSAEHDVSILSAHSILKEIYYDYYTVQPVYITREGDWIAGEMIHSAENLLTKEEMVLELGTEAKAFDLMQLKAPDSIAFPVLHGPNGEDGTIQGMLEMMSVPYVGAGVLTSACGMDKAVSKKLFNAAGIPQVPYISIRKADWRVNKEESMGACEDALVYPMFVKPANLGSSIGISKATTPSELEKAIQFAFEYDRHIVVEQGIDARELEVAVLGNEDINTSVPGELVKEQSFYDYKAKYLNNEVTLEIPANVTPEVKKQLRKYAADAFLAIEGNGLSRVDFFLTKDGKIYINEINTFPGFTQFSMYPRLWEKTGLAYGDLIEELIQLGLQRHEEKNSYAARERE